MLRQKSMTNKRIFTPSIALKAALQAGAMLLSFALLHASALAGPLDTLQPGQWYQFPNSKLSAAGLDPCPARNCPYSGTGGQATIISAWGSGIYDSGRDQLVVWGGGHGDYGGNEVYAFGPLAGSSPVWKRLTNPSDPPANNTAYAPDGRPVSRHTYGLLQYMPLHNKMISVAIGSMYSNGYGGAATDLYDFTIDGFTGQPWSRATTAPFNHTQAAFSAYNPITDLVWYQNAGSNQSRLQSYDPKTNLWTAHANFDSSFPTAADIDTKRNLMVMLQQGNGVLVYDLNNPGAQPFPVPTSGSPNPENTYVPGFVYDPVNDRFLSWHGGTTLYALSIPSNPKTGTWNWSVIPLDSGNTVVPPSVTSTPYETGTWGRFRHVPTVQGVVVITSTQESVYFFKLGPASSGGAIPTVTLAAAPASITSGSSATLTWTSTNAASCAASGAWSGKRSTANAVTVRPTTTGTYTITCTGAGGSATQSAAITVN